MGWKKAEEAVANSGGGKFIKLENDGDSVVVAFPFCGDGENDEPVVEEFFWDEKTEQKEPYTQVHKDAGHKAQYQYKFNAYNKAEDCLAIYQCSATTLKSILFARDKYDLKNTFLEIKRSGAKGNVKTKYAVMYDSAIPDVLQKRIAELAKDRHDLAEGAKPSEAAKPANGAAANGPISDAAAQELLPKLKAMPDELRKGFLREFNVSKVRELKMSQLPQAEAWIAKNSGNKSEDAFS